MLERLKEAFEERRHPGDLRRAVIVASWLRKDGEDIPLSPVAISANEAQPPQVETPKIYPEIPLEAEMERQAGIYLEREFHKHNNIKLSKGRFKDLIMGLVVPQPENFGGRLDTPVAVFGQIPAEDQCRLAGIKYFLKNRNPRDWPDYPQQYATPKLLYLTWTDEGARFMDRKVEDVRKELLSDERGGTELDGIAQYIVKPGLFKKRFLDLPGTAVESGLAADLALWNGQPGLGGYWIGFARPYFGSLVCGRKK